MVRTKQTQHGGSLTRQAGMQVAVHGDQPEADQPEAEQFKDLDEEDWPDFNNLLQAAKRGEASKSAGKAGESSQDVGEPTRAEGGAQAPHDVVQNSPTDPIQPKSRTSKEDTQAPIQAPT